MMTTVTAYEAKTHLPHLPRLIRAVERGESVIITLRQAGRSSAPCRTSGAKTSLR